MDYSIQIIRNFIKKHGYKFTIGEVFMLYRQYFKKGDYENEHLSYSYYRTIVENLHHFKIIDNCLRKKNR